MTASVLDVRGGLRQVAFFPEDIQRLVLACVSVSMR